MHFTTTCTRDGAAIAAPHRHPWRTIARVLAACCLLVIGGCGRAPDAAAPASRSDGQDVRSPRSPARPDGRYEGTVLARATAPRHADAPRHRASRDFMHYALNALLLPLLDDDQPSRWADPSLALACASADVSVDGARPVAGARVPDLPFVVRWRLDRCEPFGAFIEISGVVELAVQRTDDEYRASVRPAGLTVTSSEGTDVLWTAFLARTPHALASVDAEGRQNRWHDRPVPRAPHRRDP